MAIVCVFNLVSSLRFARLFEMSQNVFEEIVSSVVNFFESLKVAQTPSPAVVVSQDDEEADRQKVHQRVVEWMDRHQRIHEALLWGDYDGLTDDELYDLCEDFPCPDAHREWERRMNMGSAEAIVEDLPEDSPSAPATDVDGA